MRAYRDVISDTCFLRSERFSASTATELETGISKNRETTFMCICWHHVSPLESKLEKVWIAGKYRLSVLWVSLSIYYKNIVKKSIRNSCYNILKYTKYQRIISNPISLFIPFILIQPFILTIQPHLNITVALLQV